MSRPAKPALPVRDGVSASAVFCPAGPWATVADFLAERLPLVSRADWLARLAQGDVLDADGQALPPGAPYRAGGRLFYWRQVEAEVEVPFAEQIVFEDEHLLVADKPHFLPVTPGGRYVQQTLLTRLRQRTGLDRETAGLVVFSKRAAERAAYQNLFRDRAVSKVYHCIAADDPGCTEPRLLRHRLVEPAGDDFMQMQVLPGEPNALTQLTRLDTLPGGLARYELRPHTGLKHQLRAQMAAIGLPILGDRIYPVLQPAEDPPCFDEPLQLRAMALGWTDPITREARCWRLERGLEGVLQVQAGGAAGLAVGAQAQLPGPVAPDGGELQQPPG
jgi:tRNA pseudouridine32 synthase/23S rRNA pseudouridine746 synthase